MKHDKKTFYLAVFLFIIGTLGLTYVKFTTPRLTENEQPVVPSTTSGALVGTVVFVDPKLFPQDKISYKLVDSEGKNLTYLSTTDNKLLVVEGLRVKVSGTNTKTKAGDNLLLVKEVSISN